MNMIKIIRLHELIKSNQTGIPKELAYKLSISVRSLYLYISFMKKELNAPIVFDSIKSTYYYKKECNFCFKSIS